MTPDTNSKTGAKALIVGIGEHSLPILRQACQRFGASAADNLGMLWLPVVTINDSSSLVSSCHYYEELALNLDHERLNKLYYDPTTRIWSSSNWKTWQDSLPHTRLFGRLAVWHRLQEIFEKVHSLRSALMDNADPPLNVYLVAHLHDPFASGGVIDLGYLLEKLALSRINIHVSGLLFLPETSGDPIVATCTSEAEKRLYQATTYAALKELHFHLGQDTFYKNHHYQPSVKVNTDKPIFFTGDCYLLGGTSDKNTSYDQIVSQAADWIYLQTITPMRDELRASEKPQGFVSTFGIREIKDGRELGKRSPEEDPIIAEILQRIMHNESNEIDPVDIQEMLSPPSRLTEVHHDFSDSIKDIGFLSHEDSQRSARDRMEIFEQQFTAFVGRLQKYEREQSEQIERYQQNILDKLTPHSSQGLLHKLRQRKGITLPIVQMQYDTVKEQITGLYDKYSKLLNDEMRGFENENTRAALKQARYRFEYATQPNHTRLFFFLSIATAASFALFLLVVGLVVQTLFWMIGVWSVHKIVNRHLNQKRQNAEKDFIKAHHDLAELQCSIIRTRVYFHYYYGINLQLQTWLKRDTNNTSTTHIDRLIQHVQCLSRQHKTAITEHDWVISSTLWADFAPHAVEYLWQQAHNKSTGNLDQQTIFEGLNDLIYKHRLHEHLTDPDQTTLSLIKEAQLRTSLNLSLDHQEGLEVIGVVNPTGIHENKSSIYTDMYKMRTIPLERGLYSEQTGTIVFVRLQNDIPLHKLRDIAIWCEAYRERATLVDDKHNTSIHYSFLHPTRLGVAVPNIINESAVIHEYPHATMLITLLLHMRYELAERLQTDQLNESDTKHSRFENAPYPWDQFANRYHIAPGTTPPNFDELCGALQMDISNVQRLLQEAHSAAVRFGKITSLQHGKIIKWWLNLVNNIPPKESERYADWEIFTLDRIRRYNRATQFNQIHENDRRAIQALATLISYLYDLEVNHDRG